MTFESLSSPSLSILGSTGADDCFNDEYARLYLEGRYRSIEDIKTAKIHACHRAFLESIQVRANLVVPILKNQDLWGLLVAHHCQSPRPWQSKEVEAMQSAAKQLETAAAIRNV